MYYIIIAVVVIVLLAGLWWYTSGESLKLVRDPEGYSNKLSSYISRSYGVDNPFTNHNSVLREPRDIHEADEARGMYGMKRRSMESSHPLANMRTGAGEVIIDQTVV